MGRSGDGVRRVEAAGASSEATPWRRTKARRGGDASGSGDRAAASEDVEAREEGSREEEAGGGERTGAPLLRAYACVCGLRG